MWVLRLPAHRSLYCCNSTLPSGINKVLLSRLSLSYILTPCADTRCDGQSLQDLVKFYRERLVPKGWLGQRCPPEKSSNGNSVNKQILPFEALKQMPHCLNGELCVIMNLHEIHIRPFTHRFTHWWQRLPCEVLTAHQEHVGLQYLAQGLWMTWTRNHLITGQPTLPPELPLIHIIC